ncbi:DUF4431 domain-containing protein [Enterobacter sp. DNB-S2]|uniref:DUF4431 domain-containing protein n=1 Tax=Enterobacter sp. DNB-S2 TaxID=2720029 RepID=UPI001C62B04B|nr:DUF4431 domain-containing protein [Enterobacter sp. DNB-S2]QYH17517.1 DUF4431 domain-containing protein [Enterobacter sp. DNB-S2]
MKVVDFLSSDIWQGLSVLVPIAISLGAILYSKFLFRRGFRTKNSRFKGKQNLPKDLYEGQNTTLYGKVREEVFPGPPNYESINDGDEPQFYWILYVNEPIKLAGRSMEDDSLYEKGSSCMFQLCLTREIYDKRLDILNKYVSVQGEIFLGHTGHHKTKALLDVNTIKVIK